jgi:hypothetical protein
MTNLIPATTDVREYFEKLCEDATRDTKRRSLAVLWTVLEDMRKGNVRDYSISEVGRRLEKAGGPKTQSLRNEGGKDFRDLIATYAAAVGRGTERIPRGERTQLDIALDAVADPGMRALFKQVVAENRMLKHQNDELRSAFKSLSVKAPRTSPVEFKTEPEILPSTTTSLGDLVPSEVDALRRSIDQGRLDENGWSVQSNGSVVDDTGTTILPPGFAIAISKVISRH